MRHRSHCLRERHVATLGSAAGLLRHCNFQVSGITTVFTGIKGRPFTQLKCQDTTADHSCNTAWLVPCCITLPHVLTPHSPADLCLLYTLIMNTNTHHKLLWPEQYLKVVWFTLEQWMPTRKIAIYQLIFQSLNSLAAVAPQISCVSVVCCSNGRVSATGGVAAGLCTSLPSKQTPGLYGMKTRIFWSVDNNQSHVRSNEWI